VFSYCLVRVSARKLLQDLGLAVGEVLSFLRRQQIFPVPVFRTRQFLRRRDTRLVIDRNLSLQGLARSLKHGFATGPFGQIGMGTGLNSVHSTLLAVIFVHHDDRDSTEQRAYFAKANQPVRTLQREIEYNQINLAALGGYEFMQTIIGRKFCERNVTVQIAQEFLKPSPVYGIVIANGDEHS
jgi:hypothetical protein